MRILGIDPGLATVGWGVIDSERGISRPVAFGSIRTPAHTLIESRLQMIESDLAEIINKYKPDEMAVEELFFNTNITTGIRVAEARGVILLSAHQKGVRISEYTPLQVKQSVVGYGRAEKKQVISMVTILGYSAMASTIGGTGLGQIAIIYGHQRSNGDITWLCVFLMVIIVQVIQVVGMRIVRKSDKRINK